MLGYSSHLAASREEGNVPRSVPQSAPSASHSTTLAAQPFVGLRKKPREGMLVGFRVMLTPRLLRRSLCPCHNPAPSLSCPSGPGMQHNEHLSHPVDFTPKPFPALASFFEPVRHFWASLTCSSAIETALDSYFQSLDTPSVAFSNSLSLTSITSSLWGQMCPHYIQYTISQGR